MKLGFARMRSEICPIMKWLGLRGQSRCHHTAGAACLRHAIGNYDSFFASCDIGKIQLKQKIALSFRLDWKGAGL